MRRSRFQLFLHTLRDCLSDSQLLVAMALVTGLITGVAAYLLKRLVAYISSGLVMNLDPCGANWVFLIFPVGGILLTGIYQRYVLRQKIYHGVSQLGMAIAERRYRLPGYLTYAPIVASSLTLGFGGSAGAEGPIAYAGAAIGSNVARSLGVRPDLMRFMLACGASAGIAAIFKAPVGGAFFSLEVLSVSLSVMAVLAVFIASLTAWFTAYALSGCTTDVAFEQYTAVTPGIWPYILLLGMFCGIYSFYYSRVMHHMVKFYFRMENPWMKNLLSGAVVAVCVFLFPALWGEGYGFIAKVLAGHGEAITSYSLWASRLPSPTLLILMAAGMLLVKPLATSSTNSGGGVAGDFAPTIFAGCIAGYSFALTANTFLGLNLPVVDFAFFGMAAVMAGAIQAPLMAIFLVVEMVSHYSLLLPVTVAATISYVIVKALGKVADIHWFYRHHSST